jgi:hypothetical protein
VKTIIAHPDNINLLRQRAEQGEFDGRDAFPSFRLVGDRNVPRDKPSGRYVLPGGQTVPKDQIRLRSRFVEYGPEDLGYLLLAGIVREERETVFYMVDDRFRVWMDFAPVMPPRHIIIAGVT